MRLKRLLCLLLLAVLLTGCMMSGPIPEAPIVSLDAIPAWSGDAFITIDRNVPGFTAEELTTECFERYSPLDDLGRCGTAYACVGREIMPTEDRGSISSVTPSGWVNKQYDFIDGKYLYNRCHLIGYQLTGENANKENLITGTNGTSVGKLYVTGNGFICYRDPDDLLCSQPVDISFFSGYRVAHSGLFQSAFFIMLFRHVAHRCIEYDIRERSQLYRDDIAHLTHLTEQLLITRLKKDRRPYRAGVFFMIASESVNAVITGKIIVYIFLADHEPVIRYGGKYEVARLRS